MPVDGYRASVVIREKKTVEEAEDEAAHFKHCPFLLAYGLNGKQIVSVFMAPQEYEWWINFSELFPESESETFMIKDVYYPFKPREIKHSDSPPCGADCTTCGLREEKNCKGCIATR
jgi:hypothetical protein